jgi:excisionase family DNA binding protein
MDDTGFLTTQQAAAKLGLGRERTRELAATGRFPGAARLGRDWIIPAKAVEEFTPQPHGVRLGRKSRKRPAAE